MTQRMIRVEGDPAILRDTQTGTNFHLESSIEVVALAEIINDQAEKIADLQNDLSEYEVEW